MVLGMEEAIKEKKVMLWGLKRIDSKLLKPYEKTYKPPTEKRGRPKAEKADKTEKTKKKKREFSLDEDYEVSDLDFLNSEYDRISNLLESGDLDDDRYEELENIQDKLYELIEGLEGVKKFQERQGKGVEQPKNIYKQVEPSFTDGRRAVIEGGLIVESDKFKCPLCDVSFDQKQKMVRHIGTKKHEANLVKNNIANKTEYNKGLLEKERKKREVKVAPVAKVPKTKSLKPYFFIGEIPEGFREATELEALETGKYSEFGKYRIDPQKFKDYKEIGNVFDEKLSEEEMFSTVIGLRARLKRLAKEYSKLINRHGFSKLPKTEQEHLKREAEYTKDLFNRTGIYINKYTKILTAKKGHPLRMSTGQPFKDIVFNIDTILRPNIPPYSEKMPTPEPILPKVEAPKKAQEAQKIEKIEKVEKVERPVGSSNGVVFKCDGRLDLVLFPKHFLKNGKLKSPVAERLYKMNIRLTEDFYTDKDIKKYFYHKQGSGFFDKLYKYIPKFNPIEWWKKSRTGYSQQTQQALNRVGNDQIRSIQIMRAPVTPSLLNILNVVSYGDFQKRLKETPYDKLFHLSIIVNGNVLIEKLELISVQIIGGVGGSIVSGIGEGEEGLTQPEFKTITSGIIPGLTINKLLENCRNKMGDYNFFSYSGSTNNCQDFITNLLQASGIGNKEDYDFIKQNIESIFEGKEGLKKFMDYITDLKGIWTDITGGKLQYEKPVITHGSKIQSVLFDKSKWSKSKAVKWLRDKGYDGLVVDEKPNRLRYRQIDPQMLEQQGYEFRTLKMPYGHQRSTNGIEFIIGFQKTTQR